MTRRNGAGMAVALAMIAISTATARADTVHTVEMAEIEDLKTVYAEVRSVDTVPARARIGGTVATLSVDEGQAVEAGEVIATVGDPKLALKLESLAAQINAVKAERDNALTELKRGQQLRQRGIIAQARLDQLATAAEVVAKRLESAIAERSVVEQQLQEGAVKAPTNGRVLRVPVTEGSVVLSGETIAVIAAEGYILRLEVPERHARFMKKGDEVLVGDRQLDDGAAGVVRGRIQQVYPELKNGRVVADAAVDELGGYFIGERALVRVSAGRRNGVMIPEGYVATRFGIDFARLERTEGDVVDIVVQLGQRFRRDGRDMVEVLSGLRAGDRLVMP